MDGGEGQPVAGNDPENCHSQQNQSQCSDLCGGNGKNVANQILIVFGETATTHGGYKNTECYRCAGKYTDQGVGCLIAAAADKTEQQGKA